jgi:hypothetical protein
VPCSGGDQNGVAAFDARALAVDQGFTLAFLDTEELIARPISQNRVQLFPSAAASEPEMLNIPFATDMLQTNPSGAAKI